MCPTYEIAPISPRFIDHAYLLVSPIIPTLDLEGWRTFCRDIVSRGNSCDNQHDVVVASNPVGYIQGLCITAVREHAVHGRILDVPIFIVLSAGDQAGVVADMLDYLRRLGRTQACRSIRFWASDRSGWSRHLGDGKIEYGDHGVLMLLEPDAPVAD